MTKDLNEQLRDHYQKKKLSKVQSEALMGLSKQRQLRMYIGAIAASAALVIVLISSQLQYSISDMANEVSYNHLKGMPVEVITTNYDELNQALDRLDFKARQSVKLASFFTLEGARYCSIDGKIAAVAAKWSEEYGVKGDYVRCSKRIKI